MEYYLGIDVGSSESKATLIDSSFRVVKTIAAKHDMINEKPGYFEHDAQIVWWGDVCYLSRAIIEECGIKNTDIKAIGCSALGADLVPVDEHCMPLRNAILYGIDSRATEEIAYLNSIYTPEEVLAFNGRPLCSNDIPPKMMWLKNKEPEIWEKAYKLLTASSFITAKLTGEYVIDRFLAYGPFSPLYNKADGSVNMDFVEQFCRPDQLARVCETVDVAGCVTAEAAAMSGLAEGTPVIAGADDAAAEAISTGVLEAGDLMVMLGSSLYMIGICKELVEDTRIWPGGFLIPGCSCVQGGTNAAGTLTKWYRNEIFEDYLKCEEMEEGFQAFEQMAIDVSDIPAGSEGLIHLPYLAGERTPINDPIASGMLFGLTLKHTRKHMYKAALESIGYTIRQHLNIFAEDKLPFHRIIAVGGGTKNPAWLQIIADITDCPIYVAENTVGASFGDALMAALGIGRIESFADFRAIIKDQTCYQPDPANREIYDKYQQIYEELYRRNKDLMHELQVNA